MSFIDFSLNLLCSHISAKYSDFLCKQINHENDDNMRKRWNKEKIFNQHSSLKQEQWTSYE